MLSTFNQLTFIRQQLVSQQNSINETIAAIDTLIINHFNINQEGIVEQNLKDHGLAEKRFPKNIHTKRDKLKFLLTRLNKKVTAKEIKTELSEYGESLPNVDQSLVNLEIDKMIFSERINGRKHYFIKTNSTK